MIYLSNLTGIGLCSFHVILKGQERADADAILVLHGAQGDTSRVRAELMDRDPLSFELHRGVRALAKAPGPEDITVLVELFHRQNTLTVALDLAVGLARAGSDEAEPLLRNAAFSLPWNQSLLAAGAARDLRGNEQLLRWIEIAPATASLESIRRIGHALGEFGGPEAVALLRRRGSAEGKGALAAPRATAALQGAQLGLMAR